MNTDQIETVARAIRDTVRVSIRPGGETMRLLDKGHTFRLTGDEANTVAQAVIAAIQPTVTTVEEGMTLPDRSVIITKFGDPNQIYADAPYTREHWERILPVTVLRMGAGS